MPALEEAFGVPAGHSLRLVRTALRGEVRVWEHEEHDARGALVAVYESWSRGGGGGFVKYSPNGWVLRRSAADARRRVQAGEEEVFSPMSQPPSLRRTVERWST